MTGPTVIICIDGFDPDYLDASPMPNLRAMGRGGFLVTGRSMMPSVTNVNNVSIVTAKYPSEHGICSNYRWDRQTGEELYVESAEYIRSQSMFRRAEEFGMTSLVVTSKDKLRTLVGVDATTSISSEQPPGWVVDAVGPAPPIYSLEVNGWVIDAGRLIMKRRPVDIVYLTTTDYAMHMNAPDHPDAIRHMTILDDAIGRLVSDHPDATVLVTADHGMNAKSRMVDLKAILAAQGIESNPVPIIKDRYVVHHSNLGGCMFVHLDADRVRDAIAVLREAPGVDEAMPREEAAAKLHLRPDVIGDVVVNAAPEVVFGDADEVAMPEGLRSHGSQHERNVPIVGYNGDFDGFTFEENRDVGRYVFERVLTSSPLAGED